MTSLPLLALALLSTLGYLAVLFERRQGSNELSAAVGAVGGFACGALATWITLAVARSILFAVWQHIGLSLVVMAPQLFFLEGLLLLLLTGMEVFSLSGTYSAISDWSDAVRDGAKQSLRIAIASSLLFGAVWLLIAPGEYESYRGGVSSGWTAESMRAHFPLESAASTLADLRQDGKRAALPDAINLATSGAALLLIGTSFVQHFRRELAREYLVLPPAEKRKKSVGGFVPRGGEVN